MSPDYSAFAWFDVKTGRKSMAKNQTVSSARGSSATPGRSNVSGKFEERKADKKPFRGIRREILFPTEPTSIPHEQIDRAIDAVMARKE